MTGPDDLPGDLPADDDPILAEVRAVRERLFDAAGGTVEGLVAWLRASEAASGRAVVTLPPKPPEPGSHAA